MGAPHGVYACVLPFAGLQWRPILGQGRPMERPWSL